MALGVWDDIWADIWGDIWAAASPGVMHPTVLADLTPASAAGDVIDADLETSAASDVTMGVDGTYVCDGDPDEYFITRLFDDSEGDWHVMSGPDGYRVYVGGTIRLPDQEDETPGDAETALEGLGLVVTHTTGYSGLAAIGDVARTDPPRFSLVNSGQSISVIESLGPGDGALYSGFSFNDFRVRF